MMLSDEEAVVVGISDAVAHKVAKGPDLRDFLGPKTSDRDRSQPVSSSPRLSKGKLVDPGKGSSSPTHEVFHHPRRFHLGGRAPPRAKVQSWVPSDVDEDDVDYDDGFDARRFSRRLVGKRDVRDEDARLEYYGGYGRGNERDLQLSERRMTSAGLGSGRLIQGSGRMISRVHHTSGIYPYCSDCGREHSLPNNAEFGESFDERSRYWDRRCKSELSSMEVYEDREGRIVYRNDAHTGPSNSHHRKLSCCSHLHENISRPSTVRPRNKFVSSHGVEETFIDECSNRGKHIKPCYTDPGNERMIGDSDMRESDMRISRQNAHGNFRDDYAEKGIAKRPKLYYEFDGQLPNKLPRVVNPRDEMHHGHHQFVNHTSKNMILHDLMDFKEHTVDDIHHSHASLHGISVPKQLKCLGCGCAHSVHGTRLSPHSYTKWKLHQQQDCHISHLSPEYNYEEPSDPMDPGDIYSHPANAEYEAEMRRAAARVQTMEDEEELEERIGEPVNEIHERKYNVSPDFAERNHRYPITDKRKIVDYKDLDNCEDMMHGEDLTDLYSYKDQQIERLAYSKQKYHQSEGEHSIRFFKNYHRTLKSSDKFGPSRSYNEHHFSQKKAYHKVQDIEKRYDYSRKNRVESHKEVVRDVEFSVEPDAPEGSKEYETLVHEFFLKYSRDVNLNPWVQKRYRAQGELGTLFCVVCGKSSSKEFKDTQGLAKHCLMSRRIGLKAQHFGLHKAICVLLGWGITTMDMFNWAATVLPQEEAQAAREDLILWPPIVVIHNISMVIDNPEEQKVISVNNVESFLRGKGFAAGKMTVCNGKPADQSVILAKFLGTFSGLENAGRLHEYFTVNKRSRQEFKRLASHGGDDCSRSQSQTAASQGDEIEETILYGYMGVADDMDRLDFGTKKGITVKSRREILDFANCPVKAEEK
ncbi:hypothetical protein MLD38_040674 [Melastoma candidum]|nr:hypothetical protein MLD38_040674 [Melastoma candidum]